VGSDAALPWYRRTYRWGQTNVTERDPARYDVGWWREYWRRTRVQGVIVNAGGIVAYYPSRFPLHHRAAYLGDRDLYGELVAAAREEGLAVLARMDSNRAHAPLYVEHPDWFAVDRAGDIYISDTFHHRIVKLSPTGALLDTWHVDRDNPAQITEPDGVAVDRAGNVFVTYWAQDGVQKLSPSGNLLAQFDTKPQSSSDPTTFWTNGLQIDRAGRIWVVTNDGWIE